MTSSTEATAEKGEASSSIDASRSAESNAALSHQIASLATQSASQTEFLQRLAKVLSASFPADVVAVSHPEWEQPMMLVNLDQTANALDGGFVSDLLGSSTLSPTACDIPLRATGDSEIERTRGIHIRVMEQDKGVIALLLIYNPESPPDTITQINDLKQLGDYASLSRNALADLTPHRGNASGDEFSRRLSHPEPMVAYNRSLRDFHRNLDLSGTTFRIANESRRLLAMDRVSVLVANRGKYRLEAVSGVAVVDRRANSVKVAQRLAEKIVVLGRAIILPCEEPLPPQIQSPLDQYLDETNAAGVVVLPLFRPPDATDANSDEPSGSALHLGDQSIDQDPFAIMLLESFSDDLPQTITPAIQIVSDEATVALTNSLEHHRIFGLRFLKTMGDLFGGRNLPYTAMGVVTAAALLVASMVVQIDHKIIATGTAEPALQQNVFARIDGVVKEIMVTDAQAVRRGDPLLRLENADLESNAESLSGEIITTTKRLDSVRALLLDPATDPKQSGRMIIEQRQLESELANFESQLELVREQQDDLTIRAPIDGVVAGWQLERKLSDRPIGRGNHLMTIVDRDGPWQLRLELPDQDTAEVIEHFSEDGGLKIEFAAASNPRSTYAATLDSISTTARRTESGANVVDAIAPINVEESVLKKWGADEFGANDARSGVETTAKITCGQRSVLSSWFGDVADFFNRNVLFYLR